MSFSSNVKDEICYLPIENKDCIKAELFASVASVGNITLSSSGVSLRLSYENLHAAKRMYKFISDVFDIPCSIAIIKNNLKSTNSYHLNIEGKEKVVFLLDLLGFDTENLFFLRPIENDDFFDDIQKQTAFLRGLFLSCGSVTHPQKNYHAEFIVSKEDFGQFILNILKRIDLFGKILSRKTNYVVYLKGGDNISSFLAAIGAAQAVLELENIRILKEMRNNVNRAVNCETANISKTVDAAAKQIRCIKTINKAMGIKSLGPSLAEIAQIRLDNPDSSLSELAEKTGMTKSGINHKLRKICKIANELTLKED